MASTIYWALLGLVIERASYGNELFNRYERAYGDVLPVSGASHIYAALDRLKSSGLIEVIPDAGEVSRQPKLHYRATKRGVASYERWLVDQADGLLRQQQLWVRQLGIYANNPTAALRVLSDARNLYLKRGGEVGRPADGSPTSSRDLIDRLAAEQQRIAIGGVLTWLRTAYASFEGLAEGASDAAPRA